MKYTALTLSLVLGSAIAAFTGPSTRQQTSIRTTSALDARSPENGIIKSFAAGFAGLTFASQMAFGAPLISFGMCHVLFQWTKIDYFSFARVHHIHRQYHSLIHE